MSGRSGAKSAGSYHHTSICSCSRTVKAVANHGQVKLSIQKEDCTRDAAKLRVIHLQGTMCCHLLYSLFVVCPMDDTGPGGMIADGAALGSILGVALGQLVPNCRDTCLKQ